MGLTEELEEAKRILEEIANAKDSKEFIYNNQTLLLLTTSYLHELKKIGKVEEILEIIPRSVNERLTSDDALTLERLPVLQTYLKYNSNSIFLLRCKGYREKEHNPHLFRFYKDEMFKPRKAASIFEDYRTAISDGICHNCAMKFKEQIEEKRNIKNTKINKTQVYQNA